MLPTNSEKAKARGCNPVSSNCVVWQGPDLDCIDLCKGDTISEVIAKLATELCVIVEQFDLEDYDFSCLNVPVSEQPDNLQGLIQILIERICALEGIEPGNGNGQGTDCPENCIVSIADCFYFNDPVGDPVTTLPLIDYVTAIGNRICDILDDISVINNQIETIFEQLNDTQTEVSAIEESRPDRNELSYQVNVRTDGVGDTLFITDALRAVENSHLDTKEALGTKSEVFDNVLKQGTLGDQEKLSQPGVDLKSDSDFTNSPANAAESIGNLWVAMDDVREAVAYIQENCCKEGCADIFLNFRAELDVQPATTFLRIFTDGSTGFNSNWREPSGTTPIRVEDSAGNNTTFSTSLIALMNDPSGYEVDLGPTPVDPSLDLVITADTTFTNTKTDTTCEKDYVVNIYNTASCPATTLTVFTNSVNYQFNSAQGFRYIVNVYFAGGTNPVASQIISNPGIVVNNSIGGLLAETDYELEIILVNGSGEQTPCAREPFTTLADPCTPPTNSSATLTV